MLYTYMYHGDSVFLTSLVQTAGVPNTAAVHKAKCYMEFSISFHIQLSPLLSQSANRATNVVWCKSTSLSDHNLVIIFLFSDVDLDCKHRQSIQLYINCTPLQKYVLVTTRRPRYRKKLWNLRKVYSRRLFLNVTIHLFSGQNLHHSAQLIVTANKAGASPAQTHLISVAGRPNKWINSRNTILDVTRVGFR